MKNTVFNKGNIVKVLLSLSTEGYDYIVPENGAYSTGDFVRVPFRNKNETGVIWGKNESPLDYPISKVREIESRIGEWKLSPTQMEFLERAADYNLAPLGNVLKMCIGFDGLFDEGRKLKKKPALEPAYAGVNLSAEQEAATEALWARIAGADGMEEKNDSIHNSDSAAEPQDNSKGGGFSATLLNGVTGSGKTEVYFKIIAKMLEKAGLNGEPRPNRPIERVLDKTESHHMGIEETEPAETATICDTEKSRPTDKPQILIMLPEISLTGQFLSKFESRFGVQPILWHSSLTKAQRRENWKAAASGAARVVVGTRSSLFLPFKNLALIVLDEEHDSSYKQEDGVIYQGRDMAVLKASIEKIPIILASATPSIETVVNVEAGKYREVRMDSRYGEAEMPDITLIDMRKAKTEKDGHGQAWMSAG
ncbi:MAG: DEAD/DEAH box helicase, partial [Rickettsiales bacterium]|nr:DEAD/DEAH box helicase [Rickettsiales bacterium]